VSQGLPKPPLARIRATVPAADEVITLRRGTRLVRVHPLAGPHPSAWNAFRSVGPTKSRFDHHTYPRRDHPRRRIAYVTLGSEAFVTALAECFQDDGGGIGPIETRRDRPVMTVFTLAAAVTVLDLDGGWITRAGGNRAISTGPRARARDWARAIYRAHPKLAGLAYQSSAWGPGRCVALWERAEPALPPDPDAIRALDDSSLGGAVAGAALRLGTFVL